MDTAAAQDDISLLPMVIELLDHGAFVDEAFSLACRLNHPITDCLDAVVARRRDLPLITADRKLARKLATRGEIDVRLLALGSTLDD